MISHETCVCMCVRAPSIQYLLFLLIITIILFSIGEFLNTVRLVNVEAKMNIHDTNGSTIECGLSTIVHTLHSAMHAHSSTHVFCARVCLCVLGVAVVAKKSQAGMYIQEAWSAASDDLKNGVQVELDCCGLMFNGDAARMPCPTTNTTEPCYDKLVSAFNTAYSHAGGTGIAFSVVMGCGIGFVVCLMQGIKRKQAEAQAEKVRATNAGEFEQGELPPEDLDSIDAGAASMFDKHGFNPIVHDPNVAAQQQRRKK